MKDFFRNGTSNLEDCIEFATKNYKLYYPPICIYGGVDFITSNVSSFKVTT